MMIVRWSAGSWISRIYLAVVVVVSAVSLWELLTWDQPDANFAGTWPLLMTLPLSVPLVVWAPAEWTSLWFFTACASVCALANAAALNSFIIWLRRSRRPQVHPGRR